MHKLYIVSSVYAPEPVLRSL